ncbi:hypothetical protein [Salinimicrobium sp. GXAS 041]|uniref:hypothetical protein n=1 Tax=Salinimicrobium sp. GXAS 041 TaxID=3400806 RepID=UPI003C770633
MKQKQIIKNKNISAHYYCLKSILSTLQYFGAQNNYKNINPEDQKVNLAEKWVPEMPFFKGIIEKN